MLATHLGVYAAKLIEKRDFGRTVAVKGGEVTSNLIKEVAGFTKTVPLDAPLQAVGREIGLSYGEPK